MSKLYVLLATYNGELYVRQQIESILNQTYGDFVLAVRDDGSRDATLRVIREISGNDSRVVIVEDDFGNVGASKNFEILINYALGKQASYLAFSDQDDVWMPDKLSWLMQEIVIYRDIPVLIHSDLMVVDENLQVIHESFMKYQGIKDKSDQPCRVLPVQNFVTGCTMMINNSLARMAIPIPVSAVMHDWWIALYAGFFGKIIFLPQKTVSYRQHLDNAIGAKKYKNLILKIFRALLYKQERMVGYKNLEASLKQAKELYMRIRDNEKISETSEIVRLGYYLDGFSGEYGRFKSLLFVVKSRIHRMNYLSTIWLYCLAVFRGGGVDKQR